MVSVSHGVDAAELGRDPQGRALAQHLLDRVRVRSRGRDVHRGEECRADAELLGNVLVRLSSAADDAVLAAPAVIPVGPAREDGNRHLGGRRRARRA